jgi:Cyclin, N-terminal domain
MNTAHPFFHNRNIPSNMGSYGENLAVASPPSILSIQMKRATVYTLSGSLFRPEPMVRHVDDEYSISSSTSTTDASNTFFHQDIQNEVDNDMDLVYDRLDALVHQEKSYKVRDYIGRRMNRRNHSILYQDADDTEYSESRTGDDYDDLYDADIDRTESDDVAVPFDVDASCREKMCEWSYKICDHFHTSREIVTIAFNYLDRFNDITRCDRTAFKLASMTCLYIATKINHNKQISVATLSDLSRNEFTAQHIMQMERVILSTLDYKMNPPTIQVFLQQYQLVFPIQSIVKLLEYRNDLQGNDELSIATSMMNDIFDRATYYSELVVYDYSFITKQRHLIAISCVFNAIHDVILSGGNMEDQSYHHSTGTTDSEYYFRQHQCEEIQSVLLSTLQNNLGTMKDSPDMDHIYEIQERLLYLYSCSAEYQHNNQQQNYCCSSYSYVNAKQTYNHTKKAFRANANQHRRPRRVKLEESIPTSASPVSVLPVRERISGLQSDQFSVRIF